MSNIIDFEIRNFRGLSDLKINGLKDVNLFLGKNNSGKTTILEAIFLTIGMSNPGLTSIVNNFRRIFRVKTGEYLFRNLDIKLSPQFKVITEDGTQRTLEINPILSSGNQSKNASDSTKHKIETADTKSKTEVLTGLKNNFSIKEAGKKKINRENSIQYRSNENYIIEAGEDYDEKEYALYISGDVDESNALGKFSDIIKNKKEDSVLNIIRRLDPKIQNVIPLPDGLYIDYENIDKLLPSNLAGNGIRRILNIITSVAERKGHKVLIDEIENGLHFSAHDLLLRSVLEMSQDYNSQFFITTHNPEILKNLKKILDEKENSKYIDKISVFTIADTKLKGSQAYRYSYEGFKNAVENETEIRR